MAREDLACIEWVDAIFTPGVHPARYAHPKLTRLLLRFMITLS